MTKTITLAITGTEPRPTPAESGDFAGFRFTLTAASGGSSESDITQETTWMFGDAAPGTYRASVAPVDVEGRQLMPPVVIEVVVGDGPIVRTFLAPLGLSYTVQ